MEGMATCYGQSRWGLGASHHRPNLLEQYLRIVAGSVSFSSAIGSFEEVWRALAAGGSFILRRRPMLPYVQRAVDKMTGRKGRFRNSRGEMAGLED